MLQLYVAAAHAALFNKHHPSFLFPVHLLQTRIMLSPAYITTFEGGSGTS